MDDRIYLFNEKKEINKKCLDSYELDYLKRRGYSLETYSYIFFLKQLFSSQNNKMRIRHDENGRPYIKDIRNIYCSISHSNGLIAVSISEKNMGIDIELIRKNYWKGYSLEPILSENEKKIIQNRALELDPLFPYLVWTRKESYIKATGLSSGYDKIDTSSCEYESFLVRFNTAQYILSTYTCSNV